MFKKLDCMPVEKVINEQEDIIQKILEEIDRLTPDTLREVGSEYVQILNNFLDRFQLFIISDKNQTAFAIALSILEDKLKNLAPPQTDGYVRTRNQQHRPASSSKGGTKTN